MNSLLRMLIALLLLPAAAGYAQLTVAIQMDPNPSPYVSDWKSNPNTLRFIVTNPTGRDVPVRFSGYIEGDTRGRVAQTVDNAPVPPVIIPPGTSMLNAVDAQLLDEGVVQYMGSARDETRRSGRLPEDNFRLCVTLIAYDLPSPVISNETCSRFAIRLLLPPTLIAPANTAKVTVPPNFQWSVVPLSAGEMARYELTLIELDPGQDNVAQAMKSNIPLMQRETSIPTYQVLPADPSLEKGHRYAWQVRAFDPRDRYMFQNDGFSEIWSFTYDPPVPPGFASDSKVIPGKTGPKVSPVVDTKLINTTPHFTFAGMTRVSGRLIATFSPSRVPTPKSLTIAGPAPVKPGSKQSTTVKPTTGSKTVQQAQAASQAVKVKAGPKIKAVTALNIFQYMGKQDQPMPGVQLKLYQCMRSEPLCGYYPIRVNGKTYDTRVLVATTTTKSDGSFEFSFFAKDSTGRIFRNVDVNCGGGEFANYVKGDVYRYYQVEVVNGHLLSPSDEFSAQPMESVNVGDIFTLARSYQVTVHVVDKENPDLSLSGMNVTIMRRNRPVGVPETEGTLIPPESLPWPLKGDIIARGETNPDGVATFKDMVRSVGAADYYDIIVSNPEESVYYYATTVRTFRFSFMMNEKDEAGTSLPWDMAMVNEDYDLGAMQATVELSMTPKFPRIKGKVYRADNLIQPLKNAKVALWRWAGGTPYKFSESNTNDSGGFVFDNLPPTTPNNHYFLKIERYGYKTRFEPADFIGDGIFLKKGQQRTFPQIPLTPKLVVKGKLVDEFGRPVAATIRIGTGSDVHTVKKFKFTQAAQQGGLTVGQMQKVAQLVTAANPLVQKSSVAAKVKYKTKPKISDVHIKNISYEEEFTTPAPTGLQTLYIMPDNIALYHPDTLLLLLPDGKEDLGEFTVYLRAHRLAVRAVTYPPPTLSPAQSNKKVKAKQGQVSKAPPKQTPTLSKTPSGPQYTAVMSINQFLQPLLTATVIKNAVITVNGMDADSVDADGVHYFVWMSPGDDAEVKVSGPPDSDYIPKTVMATVGDEDVQWQEMTVPMEMGGRLTGTVAIGDVPIPGARVSLYDNPAETEPQQTFTDNDGKYTLRGIRPGNRIFLAAKSKSQFIGDTASAPIQAGASTTLDFTLSMYDGMDITTLLGFPIEVSGLDSSSGNVLLSGRMIDLPGNAHFAAQDSAIGLPFANIAVKPSAQNNANGIPFAEPTTLPMSTPVNSWDIRVFEQYQAEQHDQMAGIRVGVNGARGEILGAVSIKPSSYTFPGGTLDMGSERIALASAAGSTAALILPTLTSDASAPGTLAAGYHAVREDGSALRLRLYDFETTSDSTQSFFLNDTLSVPLTLHTNIANIETADLALDVGTLRIHRAYVEDLGSASKLDIPLEGEWRIASDSWSLDHNGLVLDKGTVKAGYIGVPFTGLKIFPTQIAFGDFSLDKLVLSGVAQITVTGNAAFGFDPGTQHWSLAVGPKPGEDFCGWMPSMPPMAPTDKILFQNFFVQSSGSKGFQMPSGNAVTLSKVGAYAINQFIPKEDFVQIAGTLDLGIPNLPVMNQIATIYEEDDDIVFQPDPINETIAVNGIKIKFNTAKGQQIWDDTGLHAGVVVSEDGAFALNSVLHRTPTKTHIVVNEGEQVQIGTEVKMTDVVGAMQVANNAWELFWFEGDLQNKDQGGRLKFTVMGDIVASDQQIGVDKIETPFGDISLIYNFQEQQLEGTLHVEQDLSGTKIVGDATLLISGAGKGWYFFCGASFSLPQPKVDGTAAFAVGHFKLTQKQLDQFAEYSYKNKGLPPQFHNFNGFFFEGTVLIPPPVYCPNFDFDFGLVSAYMICQIGANARFGMNFGPVDTYFIAIRGIGKLEAGVGMSIGIACAGVSAGILIEPNIEGMYQSDGTWYVLGDFPITLYGTTYAGWGLCDSDCEGALCDKSSASASITLGMQGYVGSDDKYFKFYFK